MAVRKIAIIFFVVIVSFLSGLVIFLPDRNVEVWLRNYTKGNVSWQKCSRHFNKIVLTGIKVNNAGVGDSPLTVTRAVIVPELWGLIFNHLRADIKGQSEFGKFKATVIFQRENRQLSINYELWMDNVSALFKAAVPQIPEFEGVAGKGVFSGVINYQIQNRKLDIPVFKAELTNIRAYGITLPEVSVSGKTEHQRLRIAVVAYGDMAIQGEIILQPQFPNWRDSKLNGTVVFRLTAPKAAGLLPLLLKKHAGNKIILDGTIDRPGFIWR